MKDIKNKNNNSKKGNAVLTAVFLLYIVTVLRITVFRPGFGFAHLMTNGSINASLFKEYGPILAQGRWLLFIYLFVGNIIWFVPLGLYLQYTHKRKRLLLAAVCGFLFSLLIESLQYLLGTGTSELDDLVLNTCGAWIGAALVLAVRWFLNGRGRASDQKCGSGVCLKQQDKNGGDTEGEKH